MFLQSAKKHNLFFVTYVTVLPVEENLLFRIETHHKSPKMKLIIGHISHLPKEDSPAETLSKSISKG
jgi:hypothetical protein